MYFILAYNRKLIGVTVFLMAALLCAGAWQATVQEAHAAQGQAPLTAQAISKTSSSKAAASPKVVAQGPYDEYLGLKSSTYVLAVAKANVKGNGVYVYKKQSVKTPLRGPNGKPLYFSKNNCMVVDTSKMEPGKKYGWLTVKMRGKTRAYILANQVTLRALDTKTFGMSEKELATKAGKQRLKACQYGLPYLGTPWKYKTNSMTKGINCFQFVHRSLTKSGIKMPKGSCSLRGLSKAGKAAPLAKLRPGDILCYGTRKGGSTTHVALYIGDGLLINSSGAQGHDYPKGGIRISKLNYRSPGPLKARNVFGD